MTRRITKLGRFLTGVGSVMDISPAPKPKLLITTKKADQPSAARSRLLRVDDAVGEVMLLTDRCIKADARVKDLAGAEKPVPRPSKYLVCKQSRKHYRIVVKKAQSGAYCLVSTDAAK